MQLLSLWELVEAMLKVQTDRQRDRQTKRETDRQTEYLEVY